MQHVAYGNGDQLARLVHRRVGSPRMMVQHARVVVETSYNRTIVPSRYDSTAAVLLVVRDRVVRDFMRADGVFVGCA